MKTYNKKRQEISKVIGFILGLGVLTVSHLATADSCQPNYDSSTNLLAMPQVSVDGSSWYNAELKLDFFTGKFALVKASPINQPQPNDLTPVLIDTVPPVETEIPSNTVNNIQEEESNETMATAQALSAIGSHNPVSASTDLAGDVDYYKFDVVAGRSYVLELFNVANNLTLGGDRGICKSYTAYNGLFSIIYDSAGNEIIRQCKPNGSGNVHNTLSFTAGVTGSYKLAVQAHGSTVIGSYNFRILPKYDEPESHHSQTTFEPNNQNLNAYPLQIGASAAINSEIEERVSQYATVKGDMDVYRIQVEVGKSYTVELFNVANNLALDGIRGKCKSYSTYQGLFPVVYDPAGNEVTRQCKPNGTGEVYVTTTFTSGIEGSYFIKVVPHGDTAFGTYGIRVVGQ